MTWTIPDQGEGANDLQSELFQSSLDAVLAGHRRTGVVSGCAVSQRGAGANMSVDVAAGTVALAGATAAVASANVVIGTADATNPRLDLVVSDGSGTLSIIAGTAAAAPKEATLDTTTYVLLAQVYVPATATTITTARITDRRVDVKIPSRSVTDVHSDQTAVNTTAEVVVASLAIPTTVAAGDVLRMMCQGDLLNNSASSVNYSVRILLGATAVIASTTIGVSGSLPTRRFWRFDIDCLVVATNDQRITCLAHISGSSTSLQLNTGIAASTARGTAAEDLTAGKNLQLAVTMGTANSTTDFICRESYLTVVKR